MSYRRVISAEFPGDHELLVDAYFSDIMAGFRNEMTIQWLFTRPI